MTRHLTSVPNEEPWEYPAPEGGESMAKDSLAAAAAEGAEDDGSTGQQSLLPKSVTKFTGMKLNTTEDVPELRARVAYVVVGEVVGHATEVMADGDDREVAKVKVESVRPVEIGATVTV